MAVRRAFGRAWGNALGGWKSQPRGPMGRFLSKSGGGGGRVGAKTNYRPSRNQVAAESRKKEALRAKRKERNHEVAKNAAIIGGAALAVGGAYMGAKRFNASQVGIFESRQGAKYVRNVAGRGSNLSSATPIKAGNFPSQIRMSPRAPIGIQGFSNAATVSHSVQRLLPPVSFAANTRRPSFYRHAGDALKNVQRVDMEGRELIPKRDMTRELRSIDARKMNWKKKAQKNTTAAAAQAALKAQDNKKTTGSKAQKKSEVQAPKVAATPAAKNTPVTAPPAKKAPPKAASSRAKKDTTPKSKNVAAPKAAITVSDIAPVKPAVGAGSPKAKSSPAKQAATGGPQKKTSKRPADAALPKGYYENNPAPLADSEDVRIVGGRLQSLDEDGNEVIIPIAGRRSTNMRSRKPVGSRPGIAPARPKAANQPRPMETVQKEATKAAGNDKNTLTTTIIPASAFIKPTKVDHKAAWYAKEYDISTLKRVAAQSDMDKSKIVAGAIMGGATKAQAANFARAVSDFRKAGKRARGKNIDGTKRNASEARAASLAGDVVVQKRSYDNHVENLNNKMASGKMKLDPREVKAGEDLLKSVGMSKYTPEMILQELMTSGTRAKPTLRDMINDGADAAKERKAVRAYANWRAVKNTAK